MMRVNSIPHPSGVSVFTFFQSDYGRIFALHTRRIAMRQFSGLLPPEYRARGL
jgi:hypothetical protein